MYYDVFLFCPRMTACLVPARKRKTRQRFVWIDCWGTNVGGILPFHTLQQWCIWNMGYLQDDFVSFNYHFPLTLIIGGILSVQTVNFLVFRRISIVVSCLFVLLLMNATTIGCVGTYTFESWCKHTGIICYKYTYIILYKIGNDCLCWCTLAFRRHTFCSLICRWPLVTVC